MCVESFSRLRVWSASLVAVAALVGARSAGAQTPLTVPRTSAEITLDGRFDEDA